MSSTPASEKKTRSRLQGILLNLSFAVSACVLALLLFLQAVLLIHGSWTIPDRVLTRLHEELEEQGLRAEYGSLGFAVPGRVIVKDLQLATSGNGDLLSSADVGQMHFSLLSLLQGDLEIEKITLYGGTVFCPGPLSPTGVAERILEQAHLVLSQDENGWRIHNLNGRIENLAFTASGNLPRLPERREEPVEWEPLLREILPRIIRERGLFQRVQNPRLHCRFSTTPGGGLSVAAEAWAEAVEAPHRVRVVNPYLATHWNYDGMQWEAEDASFQISSVEWDSQVTGRGVTGNFHWTSAEGGRALLPNALDLFLAQVETEAGSLADLKAELTTASSTQIAARVFTLFQGEPLAAEAELDWREGTGRVEVISRINPTPVLQHDVAHQLGLRRDIFFHEPLFVRARAVIEKWQFVSASANALARQADIDGVFLDRAAARVQLLPDRFVVPELVLAYDDFEAVGSYEIDFASKAYRFLFKGGLRPLHISAWFRDWWVNLWEDFDFAGGPLRGDVDIHSVLYQPEEVRLVGSIAANDFYLRGVPFQAVESNLFVLDNYADLFDTRVNRVEGTATGSFQYWADPATSAFAKLTFEVHSTVNPTDAALIFEEAGQEILSPFRFSESPSLAMGGMVYGAPRADETRVVLSGKTTAPLHYHGLPLDHLAVEGHIEGDAWTLPRLEAGFAGGTINGHAQKWVDEKGDQLDFALQMRDVDLAGTSTAISGWQAATGMAESKIDQDFNLKGILDMNLEAAGLYRDFQSFSGKGNLQIREADLAEVHLLGLLSRVLSVTPLGFTSLQFTEAEADFQLELNKIHVPELRLTGASSAISGSGDYLIDQDELDFLIKLHFLKESRIPFLSLLLAPVLEPLAHVMEVRLTGTSADPKWRFLLGPRNILGGLSTGGSEDPPKEELKD